jgi:ubiquinone/menaquinone biosynthesis C-methylase UbiE
MALSLPSDTFDLVSSNEVLEHVPYLDKALSEICRVLKSGGWHIGTCPFRFMNEESQRRARLANGRSICWSRNITKIQSALRVHSV